MSHFTVLVIGRDIDEQLAPFDENIETELTLVGEVSEEDKLKFLDSYKDEPENLVKTFDELYAENGEDWNGNSWKKNDEGIWEEFTTYNPDSKWDWYKIGGRWKDFFKLKGFVSLRGDSNQKSSIDFDGMRDDARLKALVEYDKILNVFGGDIPKLEMSWKEILALENKTIDEKRKYFHAQPSMVRVAEVREKNEGVFGWFFELEDFNCTREEYGQKAYNGACSTYAVVKDGQWFEKGQMGWFGISSNDMAQDEWDKEINKFIDEASDDTEFTLVDCHI